MNHDCTRPRKGTILDMGVVVRVTTKQREAPVVPRRGFETTRRLNQESRQSLGHLAYKFVD